MKRETKKPQIACHFDARLLQEQQFVVESFLCIYYRWKKRNGRSSSTGGSSCSPTLLDLRRRSTRRTPQHRYLSPSPRHISPLISLFLSLPFPIAYAAINASNYVPPPVNYCSFIIFLIACSWPWFACCLPSPPSVTRHNKFLLQLIPLLLCFPLLRPFLLSCPFLCITFPKESSSLIQYSYSQTLIIQQNPPPIGIFSSKSKKIKSLKTLSYLKH